MRLANIIRWPRRRRVGFSVEPPILQLAISMEVPVKCEPIRLAMDKDGSADSLQITLPDKRVARVTMTLMPPELSDFAP